MAEKRMCANCGGEIPPDALDGNCPRCMARVTFGEIEELCVEPAVDESQKSPEAHQKEGGTTKDVVGGIEPGAILELKGRKIGRYKILEKIGEGGFGVVYMAEQFDPVQRRVALKIIKAGMDTHEVIARFEAERQALALMDHPNIAKVLDAGTTELQRPYFVMELVRGVAITDYCDQNQLSTRQRLEIFIQVCHAVQHAHQKGIIHRDIKPSNVLVTLHDGTPVPKIIDFGIAKALGQKLTEKTLFTRSAQMMGTPAYMSPEQAELSGLDIDTRSDIYSLGVLIYELLTGVTPFKKETFAKAALDEIRRMIRETEPPKPSTRLQTLGEKLPEVARHRHIEPAALSRLVRGDLDWIVMKCLEKDRGRRYETANGLAADIERHLENEPVVARPPSNIYRFQKLVRRHKLAFAAVGAVLGALLLGLGLSTWLFVKEREAHRLAAAAQQIQERLRLEAEDARASALLQRQQAEQARQQETRLRVQAEDAETIAQTEASQLGEAMMQLGKAAEAETYLREALAFQRKLPPTNYVEMAATLKNLARVLWSQDKLGEAEAGYRETLAMQTNLFGPQHPEVISSLVQLGLVLQREDKFADAEATFHQGLSAYQSADGVDHNYSPENPPLGVLLHHLAEVLLVRKATAEARSFAEAAAAIYRRHADWPPEEQHHAMKILEAVLMESGDWDAVVTLQRDSLTTEQKLRDNAHPHVVYWLNGLSKSLARQNKLEDAAYYQRQAQATLSPQPGASGRERMDFFASRGRWKDAAAEAAQALELKPTDHMLYHSLAPLLAASGDLEGYRQLCRRIIERFGLSNPTGVNQVAARAIAADPAIADRMAKDCLFLPASGVDLQAVDELAEAAIIKGIGHQYYAHFQCTKGLADYRQGRYTNAAQWMLKVLEPGRLRGPSWNDYLYVEAYSVLAMSHFKLQHTDDARAALTKGIECAEKKLPHDSNYLGHIWRDWIIAHALLDEAKALIENGSRTNAPTKS